MDLKLSSNIAQQTKRWQITLQIHYREHCFISLGESLWDGTIYLFYKRNDLFHPQLRSVLNVDKTGSTNKENKAVNMMTWVEVTRKNLAKITEMKASQRPKLLKLACITIAIIFNIKK